MIKRILFLLLLSLFISGCTALHMKKNDVAALYSKIEADGRPIPIVYQYAVIYKIDDRYVSFDEDPVFIKEGWHTVTLKKGGCVTPMLIIFCDFQPSELETIEHEFISGKKYVLNRNGGIDEL